MSETENNKQGPKLRISRLAIVSPLLSILGICLLALILYGSGIYNFIGQSKMPFHLRPLYVYGHLVLGLMVIAGIAAGIFAIKEIRNKRRILKGGQFAISGVLIGAVFLGFWVWHSPSSPFTARKRCAANLRALGRAMVIYAGDYDEKCPTADKWCDLLVQGGYTLEETFVCDGAGEGRCHYAINPNVSPHSHPRLVFLFETKAGWNQFGELELLTTENHGGDGCNILFMDNHVEFVKRECISKLKWKIEEEK
jgi:prepilin-type processing-associated H-X9-DG protein